MPQLDPHRRAMMPLREYHSANTGGVASSEATPKTSTVIKRNERIDLSKTNTQATGPPRVAAQRIRCNIRVETLTGLPKYVIHAC